jgi:hypothetical protein
MDVIDERFAVYTTVLFFCSAIGALAGLTAAVVTFGLVVASVEVAYWFGSAVSSADRISA